MAKIPLWIGSCTKLTYSLHLHNTVTSENWQKAVYFLSGLSKYIRKWPLRPNWCMWSPVYILYTDWNSVFIAHKSDTDVSLLNKYICMSVFDFLFFPVDICHNLDSPLTFYRRRCPKWMWPGLVMAPLHLIQSTFQSPWRLTKASLPLSSKMLQTKGSRRFQRMLR